MIYFAGALWRPRGPQSLRHRQGLEQLSERKFVGLLFSYCLMTTRSCSFLICRLFFLFSCYMLWLIVLYVLSNWCCYCDYCYDCWLLMTTPSKCVQLFSSKTCGEMVLFPWLLLWLLTPYRAVFSSCCQDMTTCDNLFLESNLMRRIPAEAGSTSAAAMSAAVRRPKSVMESPHETWQTWILFLKGFLG